MDITNLLKFISDIGALAKKHKYTINDFKEWNKDGIVFDVNDKDTDATMLYIFDIKTKKIILNIDGRTFCESGDHEYNIEMNVEFFNSLLALTKNM